MKKIKTIGFASGFASHDVNTALGPWYWYYHPELFSAQSIQLDWEGILSLHAEEKGIDAYENLQKGLDKLEKKVQQSMTHQPLLCVGGDHSLAMGTWPAIKAHYPQLGLLWVDAHMDAHTPETSLSKNFHGMPLSRLLGLWGGKAVFSPQAVCVIGVRSYEPAEYQMLQDLGVKIIMMKDIHEKGLNEQLHEAICFLQKNNQQLAMSIDLDAFDPSDCPGVGCREPDGIVAQEFFDFFQNFAYKDWVAIEVAEFNPIRDVENKTASWLPLFLKHLYGSL